MVFGILDGSGEPRVTSILREYFDPKEANDDTFDRPAAVPLFSGNPHCSWYSEKPVIILKVRNLYFFKSFLKW